MFLYCPFESQSAIADRLESLGARLEHFSFEWKGLQTWDTELSQNFTAPDLAD